MDFGRAFSFVFDDPDWLKKIAISALIGLIPVVGALYLLGWGLEVARRVATRSGTLLPDVEFGTYLGMGFQAFVVGLVYTAPLWVVNIVGAILLAAVSEVNAEAANAVAGLASICVGAIVFVLVLAIGLVLPAAVTRTAVRGSIGAGLQIGTVLGLVRAAPGAYVMALIGTLLASFIASVAGTLACGIGLIFTMAYYQAVMGHFYGQAYLQSGATM